MTGPDLVNGMFELVGGVFAWLNAYKLYKDREIKGVYWPVWIFYTLWGVWNLWYYPYLNQPISFFAGAFLVLGNSVWVMLAFFYNNLETKDEKLGRKNI